MSLGVYLQEYSKGNNLKVFWLLYRLRFCVRSSALRYIVTFFMNRSAHRHGGYIGPGAVFQSKPILPHGLHSIFISRYARIGAKCCIYQSVTIGEVDGKAPTIGDNCLIGAGAIIIGGITIGNNVKIGAGALVVSDVPDHSTILSEPSKRMKKESL